MAERDRVILGLECCMSEDLEVDCEGCPYSVAGVPEAICMCKLMRDAHALLKPRALDYGELMLWDGPYLIEDRVGNTTWATWVGEVMIGSVLFCRMVDYDGEVDDRPRDGYGILWRCWSARPDRALALSTEWKWV